MAYTVIARKYRPQTFDDLVGQEHVTRTLKNAIETDRVAHAFLFTGVRGVGKTTTARLLAKALNCEKGPTPSPCNECAMCVDITSGVDLDVLEMDGASNNSVDDVRRLQESIPYRPSRDRYKVVIVDEVHMLSQGAFNAFLKTLEEPPAHVKFIFATTESHKVPVTIRSRCQRYDFRLFPQALLAKSVRDILGKEGITADDETVALIAREAAGSMRDAHTLLDQVIAFGGTDLKGAEVAKTLGIASRGLVHGVAAATLEGNGREVLVSVDALANQGLDMLHFAKQLLSYVRDLVVLNVAGDQAGELVGLFEEERRAAAELGQKIEGLELQRAFSAMSLLLEDVGKASSPRTVLEMGLVRIATRPPLTSVAELLGRLDSGANVGGGRGPGTGSAAPPNRGTAQQRGGLTSSTGSSSRASAAPAVENSVPPSAQSSAPSARPPAPPAAGPSADSAGANAQRSTEAAAQATPIVEVPSAPSTVLNTWERIVAGLRNSRPALAAVLEHGAPRAIDADKLVVSFPKGSFFGQQADDAESRTALAEGAAAILGKQPIIEIRFDAESNAIGKTVADVEKERAEQARADSQQSALDHPRVRDAMEVFPEGKNSVKVHLDPNNTAPNKRPAN